MNWMQLVDTLESSGCCMTACCSCVQSSFVHGGKHHAVNAIARLQVLLGEQLNTPNELFYVRHHLPVPHIKADNYRLTVEGAVQPAPWGRVKAHPAAVICRLVMRQVSRKRRNGSGANFGDS
jgi:Ni,Fe-hydrogenase I small subunit